MSFLLQRLWSLMLSFPNIFLKSFRRIKPVPYIQINVYLCTVQ